MNAVRRILKIILIAAAWLAIWIIIYLAVGKEVIVPSPLSVLIRLGQLIITGSFWLNTASSILRILIGYFLAAIGGIIIGILTALIKPLDDLLSPAAQIIRATPVASFIILLFVFVAKNHIPAVTAFLMVFPVIWANVYQGIKEADHKLLEMAKIFELERLTILRRIFVPSVIPYFMTAARTGMGLAWKAGIAAEVLVNPNYGIGAALHDSKIYLETTDLFAWTVVVIIISIVLEKVLMRLADKAYNRYIQG